MVSTASDGGSWAARVRPVEETVMHSASARPGRLFGAFPTAAIYLVLTVAVLMPVFAVEVPGLGDYLNHLARVHVLTAVGHSAALQRFYQSNWGLVPYYGMDLPVAAFAQVMTIYHAGRLFVAICVLMPVIAAATLHYAVHRRISVVPAFAFLVSYNYLLEARVPELHLLRMPGGHTVCRMAGNSGMAALAPRRLVRCGGDAVVLWSCLRLPRLWHPRRRVRTGHDRHAAPQWCGYPIGKLKDFPTSPVRARGAGLEIAGRRRWLWGA